MKYFLLLLILFCLTGCGASYHYTHFESISHGTVYPAYLDVHLSKQQRKHVLQAIDQWNDALNGQESIQVVDTHFDMDLDRLKQAEQAHGFLFLAIDSHNSMVPDQDGLHRTLAFTPYIGSHHIYLVLDRISAYDYADDLTTLVLHELGHSLGAHHHDSSLMMATYTPDQCPCIDRKTIIDVAAYERLDLTHLNYCYLQ